MKKAMILTFFVLLFLLLLTHCSKKSNPVAVEPDEQVGGFIHINLITMTDNQVKTNQTVLIESTKITVIGPSDEIVIPENITCIDGTGAYLMPGLADMHVHTREDWLDKRWPVSPLILYLANGVTTIRDFGPSSQDISYPFQWRDEINAGTLDGPTIYTSGLRPGHPSTLDQEPQSIVMGNYARGVDFLKIYSYISRDDFHEVMSIAKQLGMYTAGHIPFPVGLNGVIAEGMNEIAHIEELDWEFVEFNRDTILAWQEWLPYLIESIYKQEDISLGFNQGLFSSKYGDLLSTMTNNIRAANIAVCTTIIVDDIIVQKLFDPGGFLSRPEVQYLPQEYLNAFNQGTEKHQRQFQGIEELATYKYDLDKMLLDKLHIGGVLLLLSTDSGIGEMGVVPGFSLHDELRILTENGFTPYEAIATGTVNASKVVEKMKGSSDFGTIEIGRRADLILVNKNPLDNVANIKDMKGVMANGRWYSKETLDKMIAAGK